MTKWFEEVANDASNIVSSRVRLSRNWEEYKFPSRLEPDEARTMIARLKQNFRDLGDRDGQFYEYEDLELMEKLDRTALRERRLLNRTLAEKTTPGGILCSEDERVSIGIKCGRSYPFTGAGIGTRSARMLCKSGCAG